MPYAFVVKLSTEQVKVNEFQVSYFTFLEWLKLAHKSSYHVYQHASSDEEVLLEEMSQSCYAVEIRDCLDNNPQRF